MGFFGEDEHQNDNYLDFVEDNNEVSHLLKLIHGRYVDGMMIVGIINNLPVAERKKLPKYIIEKGLRYLEDVKSEASGWRSPSKRLAAIDRQIKRLREASRKSGKLTSTTRKRLSSRQGSLRRRTIYR